MLDQLIPRSHLERRFVQVLHWDIERLWWEAERNIRAQNWSSAAVEVLCLAMAYDELGLFEHQYETTQAIVLLLPRLNSAELNSVHKLLAQVAEHLITSRATAELVPHKDLSLRYFLLLLVLPSLYRDMSKLERVEAHFRVLRLLGPYCSEEDLRELCLEANALHFTCERIALTAPVDEIERIESEIALASPSKDSSLPQAIQQKYTRELLRLSPIEREALITRICQYSVVTSVLILSFIVHQLMPSLLCILPGFIMISWVLAILVLAPFLTKKVEAACNSLITHRRPCSARSRMRPARLVRYRFSF